jgi:hypothetical protein
MSTFRTPKNAKANTNTNTSASFITYQSMAKALYTIECEPCVNDSPIIPAIPINLRFKYIGVGNVQINWEPAIPDGSSTITMYSGILFAVTEPSAPRITSIGTSRGGTITWYISELIGANFIALYEYSYYDVAAPAYITTATATVMGVGPQTIQLTGLIQGHQYTFTMTATNDQGLSASSTTSFISL